MAQSKINISGLTSKEAGDQLAAAVPGVKFVNVNHEQGFAVVTHGDGFDEATFKAAVQAAGFGV